MNDQCTYHPIYRACRECGELMKRGEKRECVGPAPVTIEGWVCRVVRGQRSAQNRELEMGAWYLPDGRLKTEGLETDGGPVTVTVPGPVLAWLVAPLCVRPGWVPVVP